MQKSSIKLLIKVAEKIAINSSWFGKISNYSFGISDLNIFAFEVKYSINWNSFSGFKNKDKSFIGISAYCKNKGISSCLIFKVSTKKWCGKRSNIWSENDLDWISFCLRSSKTSSEFFLGFPFKEDFLHLQKYSKEL